MPRAYTEEESARIRAGLMAEGLAQFTAHGLQKVTVSELTEAVGIGKGSFYLFFGSKEALFFAVQEREEAAARARLAATLAPLEGREAVEAFFRLQFAMLDEHPFLRRLADPRTVAALRRKLPPEQLAAHMERDARYTRGLVAGWVARGILPEGTDPDLVHALSASAFALAMSRDIVGEAQFPAVTRALSEALAMRLCPESAQGPAPAAGLTPRR